jgi:thermitase
MPSIEYYTDGKLHRMIAQTSERFAPIAAATPKGMTAKGATAAAKPTGKAAKAGMRMMAAMATEVIAAVRGQADRLGSLLHSVADATMLMTMPQGGGSAILPTPTLVVEGASKAELKKLEDDFGVKKVDEGSQGKVLLRAPEGGEAGIRIAANAAKAAYERGHVKAAHPNFVRVLTQIQIKPAAVGEQRQWNHMNDGNPGIPGADVAALAAWLITKGKGEIRVAVLDEGVDISHPALKAAVVGQKDFVDGHPTAAPDGDDAHGTACAGIIVSRDSKFPGLAPECSLVPIRVAKGDGNDGWVFDDFKTADAIDWAWKEGKADVLSNSWGGGPPVDVISRAFDRARTKGRNNKGAVIVIAAGNNNGSVNFPATIPNILTVGASTPWDELKSPTSKDGEEWWGSNFGPEISLVAPGVKITTTDIQGPRGYSPGNFVTNFNGTSSATPHVAAAAALILSVMPSLTEQRVREIITASADRLTSNGNRDNHVGWGRLNIFSALRLARR